MALAGHCHSGRVAACAPSRALVRSRQRRLERLLSNGRLKARAACSRLAAAVLLSLCSVPGRRLVLILDETLSGAPPEQVAEVAPDIIYRAFGRELSMGKSMGLMSMVGMVSNIAKAYAESKAASA